MTGEILNTFKIKIMMCNGLILKNSYMENKKGTGRMPVPPIF
jgi:hypothetical protein